MSRRFVTGKAGVTLAFERAPLLVSPARRRLGRVSWFTIGVLAGLIVEALAR